MSTTYEEKLLVGYNVTKEEMPGILQRIDPEYYTDEFFKEEDPDESDMADSLIAITGFNFYRMEDSYEGVLIGEDFNEVPSITLDEDGFKVLQAAKLDVMKKLHMTQEPQLYSVINTY
jgi:hypothetical protein